MGFSRKYIKEKNFVLTLVRDRSDNKMLEEHVRILTTESKDMHPLVELADVSELQDLSGFTEAGVAESASMEIERRPHKRDRLAILVSNDEVHRLASIYSAISFYFRCDVRVFREFLTAVKWLGMDDFTNEINELRGHRISRKLRIATPETAEQIEEYFDLRWRVLRAPWKQPLGSERDAFDPSADHVTAHDSNGRLVGVGRVHLNGDTEAQIRYMATEEDCRGLGVGRAILERLEQLARAHGVERIVLNARDDAVEFYERLGYSVIGPGPTLFDEINHSQMEKRLQDGGAEPRLGRA